MRGEKIKLSDKSLLPFVASSLNDVYSKLDEISNQLKKFGNQFTEFLGGLNEQINEAIGKIRVMHNTLERVQVSNEFKSTTKLFNQTLDQINEGIWYVDFLLALKRILNVVQEI